ncbi:methyltransferase family protein [Chitinophaga dinghuensis]|uniref:Methyltransferase family protein n=1 Tax=Chitinophaga dinghuensis TaxID=1539050 RepID=A0A327VPY9_9BACT|nr:class I SAM-dependent methyltransferase [Chitinophaga dinghuensis]RAJ77301.1 methyltransferase family protein [Chitinophaga dinghuensis]
MDRATSILDSWQANAANWIATIDHGEIASRILVTNAAIVQTILHYPIESILDIGCGEGWLTRALQEQGKSAFGVDAIPALIENALQKGGNHYAVASFQSIVTGAYPISQHYDAAVINFALLDEEETESLLQRIRIVVKERGFVFIQTLHPLVIAGQEPYVSGWKEGSWNGMKRDFVQPYQWYFRTMGDWVRLFSLAGLEVVQLEEPVHPETEAPISLIFVLRVK